MPRQLRTHVDQLAKKEYWRQFDPSPHMVVAFIPGDQLLAAAFEADPSLQEHAMANNVLLTTPVTLIALLRTVALGWKQETMADNAREVQKLGSELYERLRVMTGHMQSLQRSLTMSVDAYNKAVGSLESRVLVTARRFPSLGVVVGESSGLVELSSIEAAPRRLQAVEAEEDDHRNGTAADHPHPSRGRGIERHSRADRCRRTGFSCAVTPTPRDRFFVDSTGVAIEADSCKFAPEGL